ncbi:MAG: hypothetical protein IPK26_21505 [Planctomycetes bacterium]|nr:hypothetical protein [Planctomycetota bacterium]
MSVSLLALIAANVIPLVGTLFLEWDMGAVLALYWLETAVIGVFTVLKLLTVENAGPPLPMGGRLFMAVFFCVHFGLFQFVHGVFLVFLLLFGDRGDSFSPLQAPARLLDSLTGTSEVVAVLGVIISHAVSFVANWLIGRERERLPAQVVLFSPYRRVVAMHLTLLLGAFVTLAIGSTTVLLAILVIAKTIADARAHASQHRLARIAAPTKW